jgi:hypothetical protein
MSNDESMELLRKELETFDKDKLRHLLNQINMTPAKETKPRKHSPQHGAPISYTSVCRHYKCLLCESEFTRTDKFVKDEVLTTIDNKGSIHTVRISGKAGEVVVPAYTNRCNFCYHRIQDWSREELEKRFVLLMESCTFRETANYAVKVKEMHDASI